jgi:sodium transport system permease protein
MQSKHILIILKKELTDFLRDRRTLLTSVFMPGLIIIVLFTFLGSSQKDLDSTMSEDISIALTDESNTDEAKDFFKEKFKTFDNITLKEVENPKKALKDGDVRLLIDIEKDFLTKLNSNEPFDFQILYDESKLDSAGSLSYFMNIIESIKTEIAKSRLVELDQDPNIIEPFNISQKDMSSENNATSSTLIMILPMILSILIAQGGGPVATDLIAGEKERNTFEPLLTTKASRASILVGKYLSVTILSFLTVSSSLLGYFISFKISPDLLGSTNGFQIDPLAALLTFLIMIILGCTYSGISVTLSTYAKSFKESQTYVGLLIIIAMIPAYGTMFMQVTEIKTFMFFVPILNAIVSIKSILADSINYINLSYALISSIAYVTIVLILAFNMFNKEKVLFRN